MEANKELKSIINSGRIPNAFLFEGPAGSGKLKSAIDFTQSLFMLNSSNNNLDSKDFNRSNIDQIISTKISNLPILKNNTDNVIEFNDGFSNEIKNDKPRNFWNLLN